jgi:hypothetical protein
MAKRTTDPTLAQGQAERLYQALEWADLTMSKLARKAGLKQEFISDVLAARQELDPLAWCVPVAEALQVDPRWPMTKDQMPMTNDSDSAGSAAPRETADDVLDFGCDAMLTEREPEEDPS